MHYSQQGIFKAFFSRTRQESNHRTFSQDALFAIFGPQKAQIGRLEKIQQKKWPPGIEPPHVFSRRSICNFWPPKSSNWTSWENPTKKVTARNRTTARFLKTLYLQFLAPKKLKLDVLRKSNKKSHRQESNHRRFSQDALFAIFSPQKAQIGRLENPLKSAIRPYFGYLGRNFKVTSCDVAIIRPAVYDFYDFLEHKNNITVLQKSSLAPPPSTAHLIIGWLRSKPQENPEKMEIWYDEDVFETMGSYHWKHRIPDLSMMCWVNFELKKTYIFGSWKIGVFGAFWNVLQMRGQKSRLNGPIHPWSCWTVKLHASKPPETIQLRKKSPNFGNFLSGLWPLIGEACEINVSGLGKKTITIHGTGIYRSMTDGFLWDHCR